MSTFEIKMPKLGESVTEGTIVTWNVKVGDSVEEDETLFEVTTAKVNAEIPSPVAGTVSEILFKAGDVVPVGVVVALIQLQGEESKNDADSGATEKPAASVPEKVKEESPASSAGENKKKSNAAGSESDRWYSPIVLSLANEAGIPRSELDTVPGTGYQGRLSKKDITEYISGKSKPSRGENVTSRQPEKAVLNSPATVRSASLEPVNTAVTADGDSVTVDMDPVGRIIADRMVESKNVSAHVTTVVEADVTKLVAWRNNQKDAFLKREGVSLTYMPAIVWAVSKALKEFPKVNASVDGYRYILKHQINMGIAVSLDDGNLVVPVIHNTDKLSLSGIALAVDGAAKKARANKLTIGDIEGGTFTITNFGTFRNIIGTPIINQPQVAILGVGYFEKKPAVIETPEGDTIGIRHKAYLSLSYDHRIINGALGGAFLKRVADLLENWDTL